jgi:hypothetical protein
LLLKRGICLLQESHATLKRDRLSLAEQPFDLHLLNWSPFYRRSRKLYLDQGGSFLATLVSSPRTLSSSILLEQKIEYSPIEKEMIWLATDPIESKNLDRLLALRTYSSSLFHEQSHRILWKLLPSCPSPQDQEGLRRFLNFTESLVIVLDMALADELGPELASLFYLTGVTYDPGSTVRLELPKRRDYRNYLQAVLHATYLNLEFYEREEISRAIRALFPTLRSFAERAAVRSGNLDRIFIQRTNPLWQKRNKKVITQKLFQPHQPGLSLSSDAMENYSQYLFAEKWFDRMGL